MYFHETNGHQRWQGGDLPFFKLMALTFKTLRAHSQF